MFRSVFTKPRRCEFCIRRNLRAHEASARGQDRARAGNCGFEWAARVPLRPGRHARGSRPGRMNGRSWRHGWLWETNAWIRISQGARVQRRRCCALFVTRTSPLEWPLQNVRPVSADRSPLTSAGLRYILRGLVAIALAGLVAVSSLFLSPGLCCLTVVSPPLRSLLDGPASPPHTPCLEQGCRLSAFRQ